VHRQEDTVSPKLFTFALEDLFKKFSWLDKGISIDGKHLRHLKQDIMHISNDSEELSTTIRELQQTSKAVGLTMNIRKSKITAHTISMLLLKISLSKWEKTAERSYLRSFL